MHRAWKLRLLLSVLSLALAGYILVPSFVYFSLPENDLREVRRNKNAFDNHVPSWAPKSHIVPGLDLQGGIHMVLGVDVVKAITDKTARSADRLRSYAQEQKVSFISIEPLTASSGPSDQVKVTFAGAEQAKSFVKKVLDNFGEFQMASDNGTELILQLHANYAQSIRRDAVDQTITTIRSRIDKMGVTEPSISKRGDDQVQIQLPGYDDAEEAKSLIGRTAQLAFQMCNDDNDFLVQLKDLPAGVELVQSGYTRPNNSMGNDIFLKFPVKQLETVQNYLKNKVPEGSAVKFGFLTADESADAPMRTYTLFAKTELSGDDLVDARVSIGSPDSPRPGVGITFSPTGARIFDQLTAASVGKRMAIVLEDRVNSAPVINERISGGSAQISMGGARTQDESLKEANQLALVLKSGALPAPVSFKEERSVGPSLGADSIEHAKLAFVVGFLLVALFMMFYYRLSGVISIVAVIFNVIFILATLSLMGATLTLPGVAGILLTIGMAVDANVIINERIREELRLGKTARSAIQTGYEAAYSAIIDANVTTFLAGIVLWQFGSGPVQNFATTLLIGTVFSVITGVFVSRVFFDMVTENNPQTLSI